MQLTDEQKALDEAVGRLLGKTSHSEDDAWAGLVEMGLIDAAASGDASTVDLAVVARQCGAHALTPRFIDEVAVPACNPWLALSASWFAGLARGALALALDYVKERHQFGVPIGSFQVIQHRLADLHTAITGAELLAHEATVAVDTGDHDESALAAMAHWWCGQIAVDSAEASLHLHGGYGFMLEYDVQLFVRRAKAARRVLGDPQHELQTIAEQLWGDGRRGLDRPLDPSVDEFRREVRAFIAEHVNEEIIREAHRTGTMHNDALHRAIASRGYLAAGWPVEVGGGGRTEVETAALMQELYGSGAPVDSMGIVSLVAATLVLVGTDQQRTAIVPRMLAGDVLACLGYSEPDAGSDVAAVQTRAIRDGEAWTINGQKMFTTMAHMADYVFLLTRTSPDKPKHKGLTMFLVPMDTPGIEITPVHTLGGERTNITFYTDVRVPDSCRVGDVDAGWSVMNAALVYERNSTNWGEPDLVLRTVVQWAQESGALRDPLVADRLARHAAALEVGRLLVFHCAELSAAGVTTSVEGSMGQLFVPEAFTRLTADCRDLVPDDAPIAEFVDHAYRHSQVTTIYGGTSEIQRSIIAERGLGLPRAR